VRGGNAFYDNSLEATKCLEGAVLAAMLPIATHNQEVPFA